MRRLCFLVVLAFLAACAPRTEISRVQPLADVQPPVFRLVEGQTSVERFDPPGAGATVGLGIGTMVHNPNPFPVRLTLVEYTISLEGRPVGRGTLRPEAYLATDGTIPLRFDLNAGLGSDRALLRAVVRSFAGRPLAFQIDGRVTFETLSHQFRSRNRTLVAGGALARESVSAPTLRLVEGESDVFQLANGLPVVRVVINASNPGDVGYFLNGKDLALSLGGHPAARADLRPTPVPARGTARLDLLFYPDAAALTAAAEQALDQALAGVPTTLDLTGQLSMDVLGVDTFPMPDGWRVAGFVRSEQARAR